LSCLITDTFHVERLYKEFGQRLRSAREDRQLTQKDVADRVGLKRTSITNIERGRQHIALHQLFLLAKAVGREPVELLPDGAEGLEDLLAPEVLEALSADRNDRDFFARVIERRSLPSQGQSKEELVKK
jgi:transcriptional regulator with XRE-family HTH domain